MSRHWRAFRYLVGHTLRAHPFLALGALLDPAAALGVALSSPFVRALIDGIVEGDRRTATIGALGTGIVPGLAYLAGWGGTKMRLSLSRRMGHVFDREAARAIGDVPGLEHLETPAYLDEHQIVSQKAGTLGQALNQLLTISSNIVRSIVPMLILATVSPWLLLLGVLGLAFVANQPLSLRWWQRGLAAGAAHKRCAAHFESVLASPSSAKELRVFGLVEEVDRRRHDEELAAVRKMDREYLRLYAMDIVLELLGVLSFVLGVGFTLWLAVEGRAGAGDVALVALLAGGAPLHLGIVAQEAGRTGQQLAIVSRLLWLADYAREQRRRFSGTTRPPENMETGIVLDGVSFRYPGTDRWVLSEVSCTIRAGEVTAVVGENGAGKTSLMKLLCRFYDPDEGRILVDGVDLRELDIDAWRASLTMSNQDFVRFELLARETVGVGDLPRIGDEGAVGAAAERAAAADLIDRLPAGLSTQLGRRWEAGTDLSTGEWQKLALARGLMRAGPLVQLFDEPTASLDAGTEHALFERLTAAAHAATREQGTATVLVSHRFSTVRAADRILVLQEGSLVESGSHAELMAAKGMYAELFEIQAAAYR